MVQPRIFESFLCAPLFAFESWIAARLACLPRVDRAVVVASFARMAVVNRIFAFWTLRHLDRDSNWTRFASFSSGSCFARLKRTPIPSLVRAVDRAKRDRVIVFAFGHQSNFTRGGSHSVFVDSAIDHLPALVHPHLLGRARLSSKILCVAVRYLRRVDVVRHA